MVVKYMNRVMRKLTFCICENKGADQLRNNREADQCLCLRYPDRTILLHPKSEIPSFEPSTVLERLGLCRTCSEPHCWFSHDVAQMAINNNGTNHGFDASMQLTGLY